MVFMHPDRLIKLRNMVFGRPLMSTESLIQWGINVDEQDRQKRQLYLANQKNAQKEQTRQEQRSPQRNLYDRLCQKSRGIRQNEGGAKRTLCGAGKAQGARRRRRRV
jgi:hypothetical protein